MAITGEPFFKFVTKQIDIRQKSLGEGFGGTNTPRKLKTLNVYNSSTPFMRLASAVSITPGYKSLPGLSIYEQLKNSGIGDGIGGVDIWHYHNLARNFVLQGAPNNSKGNTTPSGVTLPGQNNPAYGWGYNASQINSREGYVPPPGVTKVDFEYKNDGALAIATISIKAFSATQFSLIDILYMRPGYTCLLEFGHSMYYNNKEELESLDTSNTAPFEYLFLDRSKATSPSVTYQGMSKAILKEKKKHDGNYEAFFARISKFSWKFNMDGSYDITVKLMGLGDVISSLKANLPLSTSNPVSFASTYSIPEFQAANTIEKTKDTFTPSENTPLLISDAQTSQLNFELFTIFVTDGVTRTAAKPYEDEDGNVVYPGGPYKLEDAQESENKSTVKQYLQLYPIEIPNLATYSLTLTDIPVNGESKTFKLPNSIVKIVDQTVDLKSRYNPSTFITFGVFLSMVQKICNVTDGKSNTLLQFEMVSDISYRPMVLENDDTFLVTYPGNFSSNPNKCLIKYTSFDPLIVPNHTLPTDFSVNNFLDGSDPNGANNSLSKLSNPSLAMRLSDVYLNINFITEVISNLRGSDKEADNEIDISVIDLLKGILSGVNTSLGGLNDFRVIYSEDQAHIQIVSESPILNQKDSVASASTKQATINTFGFNTSNSQLAGGSFVTSVDLNSELTDQMATQISIGAQNNSNTVNSNSTSFSSYSKGLIDTLMVKKESTLDSITPASGSEESTSVKKPIDKIDKILSASKNYDVFSDVYGSGMFSNSEYISTLEKIVTSVSPLISGAYTQKSNSPAPFFLPFNMSLEMQGLSGMKIFNSFSINGKGLPISYNPSTIQLIVKSLSHTVSLDGWSTKIDTLSRPVFGVTATKSTFDAAFVGSPSPTNSSGNSAPLPQGNFTGTFDINLTRTINSSSRMKIINAFGWPIQVEVRGGVFYGKQDGWNGTRVVYARDSAYSKKWRTQFTYTYKNGTKFTAKLHSGMHEPLKETLKAIDDAGFSRGVKNIGASIYPRDTTNAPGLLSGHSFGVAMDFNSDIYGYGNSKFKKYEKDLSDTSSTNYAYAKAVEIAYNTGLWVWGGNYRKTKDTHHFTFKPYSS